MCMSFCYLMDDEALCLVKALTYVKEPHYCIFLKPMMMLIDGVDNVKVMPLV